MPKNNNCDTRMLKISTGNSKTGPSFSLPEGLTCPGKTEVCERLCYVKTGRMNLPTSKNARNNQLTNVIQLLKAGKFAKTLECSIIAASVRTLRIHDSGDFMSPVYVKEWLKACKATPFVSYWAYTRSFTIPGIFAEILKLAKLKNVAIWLSADSGNWMQALALYQANRKTLAGIAFMETKDDSELSQVLTAQLPEKNLVIFPIHGHFGRLTHISNTNQPNCPAITKELPHDDKFPACLRCLKCLPV